MSKGGRKARRAVLTVALVLLILVFIALGLFLVYYFTEGFGGDFPTFAIEQDGKRYYRSTDEMALSSGSEFRIRTIFGGECSVRFEAASVSEEQDFGFKVNGEARTWSSLAGSDLTGGITLTETENGYKVEYGTLSEVVSSALGAEITELQETKGKLITMIVTYGKGELRLGCVVGTIPVTGIELPPEIQI